jgi:hypothetical protein
MFYSLMNPSTAENHSKLNQFFIYIAFHQFGQAKFAYCGSILSSSQFLPLLQLTQNLKLDTIIVKYNSKIVIELH